MKEWIGECHQCGKEIYCENGFFNGVIQPGHFYLCFECEEKGNPCKIVTREDENQ